MFYSSKINSLSRHSLVGNVKEEDEVVCDTTILVESSFFYCVNRLCLKLLLIIFWCLKLGFIPLEGRFIVSGCEKTLGEQIVLWEQRVTIQKKSS